MIETINEQKVSMTFSSMEEALAHANTDITVWMITIHLPSGDIVLDRTLVGNSWVLRDRSEAWWKTLREGVDPDDKTVNLIETD